MKIHFKVLALLTVFLLPLTTSAAPLFFPGQTTNPGCAMGTTNCTTFPMSIGGGVASGTPGSVPFIDNSGALQQDNQNLKWDQVAHKLTLSQGLTVGHVNTINTISTDADPSDVVFSGNYGYVASNGGTVSVIDLSNPATATVVHTVNVGLNPKTPVIAGSYMYVSNTGSNTVSVIDISNPTSAFVVRTVSVTGSPQTPLIIGSYAYVINSTFTTSGSSGEISVIDISNPATATVVNTVNVGSGPTPPLVRQGNYLYISNSSSDSVSVIDITTPASAFTAATVPVGSSPMAVAISGNYAYVPNNGVSTVSVINISNPASANVVATVTTNAHPLTPVIVGNYAYVSNNADSTVSVVDITTPPSAHVVATINVGSLPSAPVISGHYLYATSLGAQTLTIADISVPSAPVIVNTVTVGNGPQAPLVIGNYVYIHNANSATVSVVDATTPASALVVASPAVGNGSGNMVNSGSKLYVSNNNTISVIDISQVSNVLPPSSVVALSVDGTIQSSILAGSGTIALYADSNGNIVPSFSDQSLKQNITNVTDALAKVKALQGVYFNWKDTSRFGDGTELGFIAQQVEPVVPEVVRTVGGYKTLNYQNLVALENEAVKELDARLTVMEAISGVEDATKSLADQFANFLASTADKVIGGTVTFTGKIFAKDIEVQDKICINKTCITEDDLKQIISQQAETVAPTAPSDTGSTPVDPSPSSGDQTPVQDSSTSAPQESPADNGTPPATPMSFLFRPNLFSSDALFGKVAFR